MVLNRPSILYLARARNIKEENQREQKNYEKRMLVRRDVFGADHGYCMGAHKTCTSLGSSTFHHGKRKGS